MIKNKKLFYGILLVVLIIVGIGLFVYLPKLLAEIKFSPCLPADIKLNDVVSVNHTRCDLGGKNVVLAKLTVEQKLIELNARCSNGKLVDDSGREIYFYKLDGCWGNPPRDYIEVIQKQKEEIDKLKEQYTVIEMTCAPYCKRIA